eukprot:TRINITY_DN5050_c0_g1_i1.p1 TRINITY_DN5050_c0_g1~~TRINITY_DN5050_c0_g1_i1.p1  ORF type:complete len:185 (-),score=25.31 TRINITY_DN5050_c0_g1_i1:40-561(-)
MDIDINSIKSMDDILKLLNSTQLSSVVSNEWTAFKMHASDFYHMVEWKDPMIVAILCFHVMTLMTVAATRKHINFQSVLFFVLITIAYGVQYANSYLAEHWERFTNRNYFDKNGLFLSIMFSAPVLLSCFFLLINFIRESFGLLIELKTRELRQKKKAAAKSNSQPKETKKSK